MTKKTTKKLTRKDQFKVICCIAVLVLLSVKIVIRLDPFAGSVSGVISMPEGQKAFEDTRIVIAYVRQTDEIPKEQTVTIPSGKSEVSFKLKAPTENQKYFYRYTILSKGGEGSNDARMFSNSTQYSNLSVGGLSIMNHVYVEEGYLGSTGMCVNPAEKKLLDKNELSGVHLELIQEKDLQAKTDAILKKIIKADMTDYEKEKAIYDYVVTSVPITFEGIDNYIKNAVQEFENPLKAALLEQKTVWLGQPFLMKWLLQNAGIASELAEVRSNNFNFTSVYNLVHLKEGSYFVDAVSASANIQDPVLKVGDVFFENKFIAQKYFREKYFNFTGDFIQNLGVKVVTESGLPKTASNGAGYEIVKSYLEVNELGADKVVHLSGKLVLPKGVQAPRYGLRVSVSIVSGKETPTLEDDIVINQDVIIPEGKRTGKFEMDFVNNGQKIMFSALDKRANLRNTITLEVTGKQTMALEVPLKP
jgi:hypothetical protein